MRVELKLSEGIVEVVLQAQSDDEDTIMDLLKNEETATVKTNHSTGARTKVMFVIRRGPKSADG